MDATAVCSIQLIAFDLLGSKLDVKQSAMNLS